MTLFSPNTSMDLNNSYEQKVCGSLYDDPALGPAQGSPSLPIVFSTTLAALGAFGAVLNALVVIGVRGNAKLGTTVNKLLIYITCFAFLEAVYGILVRSLALAQVFQRRVPREHNEVVCRVLLTVSFIFISSNIALWTTISMYRLYLVLTSVSTAPTRVLMRSRAFAARALPAMGIIVGASTGIINGLWAEPIIIFRDCRGSCDAFNPDKKYWSITFIMVIMVVYQVPSCICYLVMYCFLKKQQSSRGGAMFGKKLSDCSSFYRRSPDGAEGVAGCGGGGAAVVLGQAASTSSANNLRPTSNDEVRPNGDSLCLSPRPSAAAAAAAARKCATKVSFKEMKKNPPQPQIVIKVEEIGSAEEGHDDDENERTEAAVPGTEERMQSPLSRKESYKRAIRSQFSRSSLKLLSRSRSASNISSARSPTTTSMTPTEFGSMKRQKRVRRKNVITAKLGFFFLIIFLICGLMLHFGYSQIPERWRDKLNLRAFINAFVLDGIICVVSPLMLLYGSEELRKSIRAKFSRSSA